MGGQAMNADPVSDTAAFVEELAARGYVITEQEEVATRA
jgi:hypothetical protein